MTVKRLYAYVVLVLENQENSRNSHSRGRSKTGPHLGGMYKMCMLFKKNNERTTGDCQ